MQTRAARSLIALPALALVLGAAPSPSSTASRDSDEAHALRARFPGQAARVLETAQLFSSATDGFVLDRAVEASPSQARGALHARLPLGGDGAVRFDLDSGFAAGVREVDVTGDGVLAGGAVAYARQGGTSYWSATGGGYEEWLMLDAAAVARDRAVATWNVDGDVRLRMAGAVVEVAGADGIPRLRVTAPAAYGSHGQAVAARLSVRGSAIELWVDAANEAVLVDPAWTSTGMMMTARENHTATLLANGKVLVAGGDNEITLAVEQSCELYDPASATWSAAASMSSPRFLHTATLLANGDVFVVGGIADQMNMTALATAEIYDPIADTWTAAGTMSTARFSHATALLTTNGNVLVTGGTDGNNPFETTEIYDTTAKTWSKGPDMTDFRADHAAVSLSSGQVLVALGDDPGYVNTAELYDPVANTFTATASAMQARINFGAVLLANGSVLFAGGLESDPLDNAEIYDPTTAMWSSTPPMFQSANVYAATLLSDGTVMIAGGSGGPSATVQAVVQIYDPKANTWAKGVPMGTARSMETATLLPNNDVLVAGGLYGNDIGQDQMDLVTAELYDPSAVSPSGTTGASSGSSGSGSAGTGGAASTGNAASSSGSGAGAGAGGESSGTEAAGSTGSGTGTTGGGSGKTGAKAAGCGCSVVGAPQAGGAWVGLALLVAARRRAQRAR